MSEIDTGRIIFWSVDKHYGFVRPDHGERDIFVRGSALPEGEKALVGDRVSYEVGPSRDARICAQQVRFAETKGHD